jgi:hypothetical protein
MPVRLSEVAAALVFILVLLAAKHVPALGSLPLTQMTGITAFSFAIFLALKLYRYELERIRAEQ